MHSDQVKTSNQLQPNHSKLNAKRRFHFSHQGLMLVLIVLVIIASLISPYFLTVDNFQNIILGLSVTGILAIGMTFVILTAGIDLSVGVLALSAIIAASYGGGNFLAFSIFALITGLVFGLLNGLGVVWGGIPAFVVTLASLSVARGLAFMISHGNPIYFQIPGYTEMSNLLIAGIPLPGLFFAVIAALAAFVLRYLPFGRNVYAVGASEEVARLSGIPVRKVLLSVYGLSGLLSGFAAILYTSYTSVAQPGAASGFELDAIAIVVIGGTSLFGGVGSIAGTVYGTVIIALLRNIFNLLNMQTPTQNVMMGLAIVIALLFQRKGNGSLKNLFRRK
jgi:ribose transport system permease protein